MLTLPVKQTFRPIDYTSAFHKFKKAIMLTMDEQAFLAELKKLKTDSMWGLAIDNVLYNFSIPKFRELIVELLSQQADDFLTSERILGVKGAKLLLNLRP